MSLMKRFRVLFLCIALEAGVLFGVPMRPEQIRALMHQLNQPKLAHGLPTEDDRGDNPPARTRSRSNPRRPQ
jgi:hypothetical protein